MVQDPVPDPIRNRIWIRIQQKWNKKSKNKKREAYFLGNYAASDIEKARICTKFLLLENCAKYCLVPDSTTLPETFAILTSASKLLQSTYKPAML
jgi:hypothetical protein